MSTEHLLVIATMTTLTTTALGIVKAASTAIRPLFVGLADSARIQAESERQVRLARANSDEALRLGWADASTPSAREQILALLGLSLARSGPDEPVAGSALDGNGRDDGPAGSDTT